MRLLLLTLLCSTAVLAAAESPVASREINKLIEQLSADSFDEREAASAELIRIGDDAWPHVERAIGDVDGERATRARALAPRLAAFAPEEKTLVDGWLAGLFSKDQFDRAEALDQLLLHGLKGKRVLQRAFNAEQARPKMALSVNQPVIAQGQEVISHLTLSNAGSAGYWSHGETPQHFVCSYAPFGMERLGGRSNDRQLMIRRLSSGTYRNPIRDWVRYGPRETIFESRYTTQLDQPGIYKLVAKYAAPLRQTICPRVPNAVQVLEFEMNAQLPEEFAQLVEDHLVYVLPDFRGGVSNPSLELSAHAATTGGAGSYHVVQATLQCRGGCQFKQMERNLTDFAWFAVLDEQGVPADWGNWNSALNQRGEELLRFDQQPPLSVTPAAPLRFDLRIPLPSKPGTYSIVLGYEVGPRDFDLPTAAENFNVERRDESAACAPENHNFDRGQLCTRVDNIVVTPRPRLKLVPASGARAQK